MNESNEQPTTELADALDVRAGFLTKVEIEKYWSRLFPETEDAESPPQLTKLKPASVDLRLGAEYYVPSEKAPGRLSRENEYVTIPHGEFALLVTHEVVSIPTNILALITMRVRHKRSGLINISGFHVDPGFTGQIFISVYNAGPSDLRLKWKERVLTIFFASLVQPTTPYDGQYQGQRGLPSDLISALGGPSLNLVKLNQRLDTLETQAALHDIPNINERLQAVDARLGLYRGIASVVAAFVIAVVSAAVTAAITLYFA